MQPLGRHHRWIRRLRALRRDAALRRADGLFIAEGYHLAREALACAAPIELAVIAPRALERAEGRALVAALERRHVPLHSAADAVVDGLQDARSPQPMLLVVRLEAASLDAVLDQGAPPALIAVTTGVQDPGNLGTLLRSADAAGGTALVATGSGADLHHPRAVRASMGSIFRMPACSAEVETMLSALQRRGVRCLAANPATGTPYDACDLTSPTAIFLGGEGAGLDTAMAERLDERIRIPLRPGVESLSVGAAGAVLLFEAARQRARAG